MLRPPAGARVRTPSANVLYCFANEGTWKQRVRESLFRAAAGGAAIEHVWRAGRRDAGKQNTEKWCM